MFFDKVFNTQKNRQNVPLRTLLKECFGRQKFYCDSELDKGREYLRHKKIIKVFCSHLFEAFKEHDRTGPRFIIQAKNDGEAIFTNFKIGRIKSIDEKWVREVLISDMKLVKDQLDIQKCEMSFKCKYDLEDRLLEINCSISLPRTLKINLEARRDSLVKGENRQVEL